MAVIEARELVKQFNGLRAVDGISFSVNGGEIFGFLGPNGAGKTTTVRMLTGVLTPDSGKAFIQNIEVSKKPTEAKERIGIAPEEANVYLDLTGNGNMKLAAELYGVPRRKRQNKIDQLLQTFDLFGRRDSKAGTYSKGMKKRLTLAMALINDPPILFLDEPTSGLDVASQRLIRERIRKLREEGKTVFLTTHNIMEADELCNRVAIIDEGTIAAIDRPETLKGEIESTRSIRVSFKKTDSSLENTLRGIDSVEDLEREGDKFRLYTSNPGHLLEEMIELSRGMDLDIESLQTMGPSLEEVFTHLTEKGGGST